MKILALWVASLIKLFVSIVSLASFFSFELKGFHVFLKPG